VNEETIKEKIRLRQMDIESYLGLIEKSKREIKGLQELLNDPKRERT